MATRLCEGRVCIVTGVGRGLGQEYALMLARSGASVVVSDGTEVHDPIRAARRTARDVVEEIVADGGQAVASSGSAVHSDDAAATIDFAVETFGRLDVLVDNTQIAHDQMRLQTPRGEWDSVFRFHLRGAWALSRAAAEYWRLQAKCGAKNDARIINTTLVAEPWGDLDRIDSGAARAGVAAFAQVAAEQLAGDGVMVNAVAPSLSARLADERELPAHILERRRPEWAVPVVTWLASSRSCGVTGQVIESPGRFLEIAEVWQRGTSASPSDAIEDAAIIRQLLL